MTKQDVRFWTVVVSAICVAAVLTLLFGCTAKGNPEQCRSVARTVFAQMLAGQMEQVDGQQQVDAACAGLSEADRKAILDGEKQRALLDE